MDTRGDVVPTGDIGVKDSGGDPSREETVADINWFQSAFFIGKWFSKLPDELAQCTMCPLKIPRKYSEKQPKGVVRRKDGNSKGMMEHLRACHSVEIPRYEEKKIEVERKRDELRNEKNNNKRKLPIPQNNIDPKQSKLATNQGKLIIGQPADPNIQTEWDNALTDFLADTHASFSQMSGPPFRKMIGIILRRSRIKLEVRTRKTLSKKVTTRSEEVLLDLGKIIDFCKSEMVSVSFASDLWTSNAHDAFLCLNVVFIDQ